MVEKTSGAARSGSAKKPASAAKTVDTSGVALTPANEVPASGALIEPEIAAGVDTAHPSVDDTPRQGTTADMNRIDFNEPSGLQSPEDTVAENLTGEKPAKAD